HIAHIPFKEDVASETKNYHQSIDSLVIEGELYDGVSRLCNQIDVTQNTFIQVIWGYLLSKYNNTGDVVFGAVVSGRPGDLEGVEN
ncbi:condensation domain-containing protein, partial [Rhizobium sp. SIMBA_035]